MAKKISNQGSPGKSSQRLAWLAFSATWETACPPLVWPALTAVWIVDPVLSRIKPEPNWGRNGNRKLSKIKNQITYLTLTEILVLRAAKSRLKSRTKIEVEKLVKEERQKELFHGYYLMLLFLIQQITQLIQFIFWKRIRWKESLDKASHGMSAVALQKVWRLYF